MAGEIVRPSALPNRANPVASEKVPVDNGSTVGGATIQALVLAGRPTASQVEAEAGTDPAKAMTPLTTKQAIQAQGDVRFASAAQGDKADTAWQPSTVLPSPSLGDWDNATSYSVNDRVFHDGSYWIAKTSSTNVEPIEGADWTLFLPGTAVADGSVTRPKLFTHFERSIPMNLWEEGVFGHDTVGSLVNETAAFQAAINKAVATKRELIIPGTNYLTDGLILDGKFSLRMRGDNANRPVIYQSQADADVGGSLMRFRRGNVTSDFDLTPTIAADIAPNQKRVPLVSVAGLAPGMMIAWTSDKDWYYDARSQWKKGEMHQIVRVFEDTNEVEVYGTTWDAYDIPAETLTCRAWWPDALTIENVHLIGARPTTDQTTYGLSIGRLAHAELNDLFIEGFTLAEIQTRACWHTRMDNIEVQRGGPTSDLGYGILDGASTGTHITRLLARSLRRGYDASAFSGVNGFGPNRLFTIDGFSIHGGGVDWAGVEFAPNGAKHSCGIGMHGPAEAGKIMNGYIENVNEGVTVRGRNTMLRNITFGGWIAQECISATYGTGLDVQGCFYDMGVTPNKQDQGVTIDRTKAPLDFIRFGNSFDATQWVFSNFLPTVVRNNTANGVQRSFISFAVGASELAVTGLDCVGNTAVGLAPSGGVFNFFLNEKLGSPNVVIRNSALYNNKMRPFSSLGASSGTYGGLASAGIVTLAQQGSQTHNTQVGPHTWAFSIADDSYLSFRDIIFAGNRAIIQIITDDTTVRGNFVVQGGSTTPISLGLIGTNIEQASSSGPLTGTGGTDGKFTLGLSSVSGNLNIENRRGATVTGTITIS